MKKAIALVAIFSSVALDDNGILPGNGNYTINYSVIFNGA